MEIVLISLAAFAVAAMTLFSGFGLGTLLMPVFALFFPLPLAVAATAVVHLLNNLFKTGLLRREIDRRVLWRFGLPAVMAALPGAGLLMVLSDTEALWRWSGPVGEHAVTPLGLLLGTLILLFALLELGPWAARWRFSERYLSLGGVLSGFFGGVSGHQGALRAMFLGRLNLNPGAFAGTQAAIAILVDVMRLAVYGVSFLTVLPAARHNDVWWAVGCATAAAFAGSYLSRRLLSKTTVVTVHRITGGLLIVVGLSLAAGLT